MARSWNITKWCKSITDSGKDEYTGRDTKGMTERFRLLDDDGTVYAYGKAAEISLFCWQMVQAPM